MNENEILTNNTFEQEQQPQQAQSKVDSEKEQNLRYLRELAERERKERESDRARYEARMKEMEDFYKSQIASSQKHKIEVVDNDEFTIDNDSYVEGRHLQKTTAVLRKEIEENKKALENYRKEADRSLAEQRIKLEHPDFYEVVTEEALSALQRQDPIAFESLMAIPDTYKRLKLSRNLVDRYGVSQKTRDIEQRIDQNLSKPRSAATINGQTSDTPLARVDEYDRRKMTPDKKKAILQMLEEAKRRG